MMQVMNILGFLILFVSIGISETLQTEWGECQLEIYDGRIEHIESINLLIHEKIQSMNDEFDDFFTWTQKKFTLEVFLSPEVHLRDIPGSLERPRSIISCIPPQEA